jgi:hypothetical protein
MHCIPTAIQMVAVQENNVWRCGAFSVLMCAHEITVLTGICFNHKEHKQTAIFVFQAR